MLLTFIKIIQDLTECGFSAFFRKHQSCAFLHFCIVQSKPFLDEFFGYFIISACYRKPVEILKGCVNKRSHGCMEYFTRCKFVFLKVQVSARTFVIYAYMRCERVGLSDMLFVNGFVLLSSFSVSTSRFFALEKAT